MSHRTWIAWAGIGLSVTLAACAPSASVFAPPTFEDPSVALVRIDPPGAGSSGVVLALDVTVRNPNPIGARVAGLGFVVALDGTPVASTSAPAGLDLPAGGTRPVRLEIVVPWDGAPGLIGSVAGFVGGGPLAYRVDANVTIDVFGMPQRFGSLRVAEGSLPPPRWTAPSLRIDPAGARLSLDGTTLTIEAALLADNPGPIGAIVRSPSLAVRLEGQEVGRVDVPATALAANAEGRIPVAVRVGLGELGAVLAARIAGGVGTFDVSLEGSWTFEVAGVTLGTLPGWSGSAGVR